MFKIQIDDLRPNKHSRVMMDLDLNAQWATCQRGRVASAIVDNDGAILVLARNGTPYGQDTCQELGAKIGERCQFCIHSEKNTINHAAKHGVRTTGTNLYTLKRPCLGCSNDIIQADFAWIYYRDDYDTDGQRDYVFNMFKNRGIGITQLKPTPDEEVFSMFLESWRKTWRTN